MPSPTNQERVSIYSRIILYKMLLKIEVNLNCCFVIYFMLEFNFFLIQSGVGLYSCPHLPTPRYTTEPRNCTLLFHCSLLLSSYCYLRFPLGRQSSLFRLYQSIK